MRFANRPLFSWVFAAFFGCASLFGQGLHLFFGHDCGHGETACAHAHGHHAEQADHDHDSPAVDDDATGALVDDDCAICQFYAQAQSIDQPALIVGAALRLPACHAVMLSAARCSASAYYSRGPPLDRAVA